MQEVAVCGPRYWPQRVADEQDGVRRDLSGGPGGALAALYCSHAVYVQRKSGALSYVDDPSGVRSLLSTAFHKVNLRLYNPSKTWSRLYASLAVQMNLGQTHDLSYNEQA